jgi:DNA repair exonuclease SbcCD ATPase subunit
MNIIFEEIYWRNLLGTGQDGVRLKLNENRMTLFQGKNGGGKSTLLDAIFYALFGSPYRDIKLGQLINSVNCKDLLVELSFSIGPNSYKIIRGMKPKVFEVWKNGVKEKVDAEDYQKNFEKTILKTNHKSMSQIVVIGSANYVPFMRLKTPERRGIIEDLLNIQIFSLMNSLLKAKITTNKNDIADIDNAIRLCEQKIEMHQKYLDSLKKNNNEIIDEKLLKISEFEETIVIEEKELAKLEKKIKSLKEQTKDIAKFQKKHQELLTLERGIEDNIRNLNKEINFFEKHNNCPTCTQEITEAFKNNTLSEKNSELSEMKEGLVAIEEHILKAKNNVDKINEIVEEVRRHENSYMLKNQSLKFTAKSIQQLQNEIEVLKVHNKNFEIDESESVKFRAEFDELIVKKKELTDLREIYTISANMLKDGGIKTHMIKKYIPIINENINSYLSMMDFMVSFHLDEDFNETILSRGRDNFSFENFSEGEKMRINMAILFSWRAIAKLRNTTNTNLLILDEVFDSGLDATGAEDLMKILKTLTKENVIIISHKQNEIFDHFDRVIEFQKVKSFSRMIEVK